MGKANPCLKRTFIILASLIVIMGVLLLAFSLFMHGAIYDDAEKDALKMLHIMYSMAAITMILAVIGIFGACKEKKWALIVFAAGMMLGSLIVFGVVVQFLAQRHLFAEHLEEEYLTLMPRDNASVPIDPIALSLDDIQSSFECCGLQHGYQEWGYNISESCLCTEDSTSPCVAAPSNSSLFEHEGSDLPVMIYSEPCIPIIVSYIIFTCVVVAVVVLGVSLYWMLTVALCVIILCQLRRKVNVPTVVYTPEAKSGNYTAFTDTSDCT